LDWEALSVGRELGFEAVSKAADGLAEMGPLVGTAVASGIRVFTLNVETRCPPLLTGLGSDSKFLPSTCPLADWCGADFVAIRSLALVK